MNYSKPYSINVKFVAVLIALFSIIVLSVFLFTRHSQSSLDSVVERREKRSQKYQEKWEQKGILSIPDHARLIKISAYIERSQQMSDDDLDFWISLLQRGPLKDTPSNRGLFYTTVMEDALGRKQLSPSGQKKMYDAVLPFVSDATYMSAMDPNDPRTDPSDPTTQVNLRTGTEGIAVMLLAQTRDPRALTVLQNLARNSQYLKLRETAQEYYTKLAAVVPDHTN